MVASMSHNHSIAEQMLRLSCVLITARTPTRAAAVANANLSAAFTSIRHHGEAMLQQLYAVVACVLSVVMCAAVVYFLISGRGDRDREEEAREYFDAHGHWPDEA